jgi:hypothetical protein
LASLTLTCIIIFFSTRNGKRKSRWPTVDAVVEIVSVANVTDDARFPSYRATLTYNYHNPEEQMGDYSRDFGNEKDAKTWANSYKGETVKAHVDPRDPARSVLTEEDLRQISVLQILPLLHVVLGRLDDNARERETGGLKGPLVSCRFGHPEVTHW